MSECEIYRQRTSGKSCSYLKQRLYVTSCVYEHHLENIFISKLVCLPDWSMAENCLPTERPRDAVLYRWGPGGRFEEEELFLEGDIGGGLRWRWALWVRAMGGGLICLWTGGGGLTSLPGGVILGPAFAGGIDEITSFFFGARQPFWPGLGGMYCKRSRINCTTRPTRWKNDSFRKCWTS